MSELKPCWHCGKPARYADKTPTMENPQGVDLKRCKCSERRCIGAKLCVEVDVWNTRTITRADIPEALVREIQADELAHMARRISQCAYTRHGIDSDKYEGMIEAVREIDTVAGKLREQKL